MGGGGFSQFVLVAVVFFGAIAIIGGVVSAITSSNKKVIIARVVSISRTAPYGQIIAEWTDPATGATYRWSMRVMFTLLSGYKVGGPVRVAIKPNDPARGGIVL